MNFIRFQTKRLGLRADYKFCVSRIFPLEKIRNFCIIAHIDHGKSTLADRLLETTGTIIKGAHAQYLDKLTVEKERGITVKAQSAAMFFKHEEQEYLLNLIDTPGHVDFTYEVSRSMRSCQGALLLVDATQGIQAQTLSNYKLALQGGLRIIPVINKIDMSSANVEAVELSMMEQFDFDEKDIIKVSAKSGKNIDYLLEQIIDLVPCPKLLENQNHNFKGFLIDSWYIKDKGVILLVQVKAGQIKKGDILVSCGFGNKYDVFEVGILNPEFKPQSQLTVGQVGYLMTNMKQVKEARVGDTFKLINTEVIAEDGFQPAKPLVFCGIYPEDPEEYNDLEKSIQKLALTDPAVIINKESSAALGNGFRCGFLGVLHMDVFKQRLDDEYDISTLLTTPNVPYRAIMKNGKIIEIENALMAPDPATVKHYEEPVAEATIMCPREFKSNMINLSQDRMGELITSSSVDNNEVLRYRFPMSEIITDFFDKVKSLTKGYGSLEYEFVGLKIQNKLFRFRPANVQKVIIYIMNEPIDALSFMVREERAFEIGKSICIKLKDKINPELFVVSIQAKIGGKVIAAEKIGSLGKNVTAKCYGGDFSRKKKLLDKQKEGKKKMRMLGKVQIKKDTFVDILKRD